MGGIMGFVAHVLIFLFMIPLVFGWLLLVAVPLGALAVGIAVHGYQELLAE